MTETWKRKLERILIVLYCTTITVGVISVLMFWYRPNQNNLGALGSVCLDVISMFVLLILVLSFVFEKDEMNRTTWLFLGLMLGTMTALFFDFLTWSFDGSLSFDGITFIFIISSLCMGSILAGLFSVYLCSYLYDMYGLKSAVLAAKICIFCNLVAYVTTNILAFTRNAFVIVNGHYKTGSLYDYVTAIPVLTLLFMTIYAIKNVKVIGVHDVIAVVGYILTLIIGALVESTYSIGTTYVALVIADVFLFLMLQNKLIDRVKKQKEQLAEKITTQYEILESMAGIYSYVNYVDLEQCTARRFDQKDSVTEQLDIGEDLHSNLNKRLFVGIEDELKDKFWKFTDLSTLSSRMEKEKIISAEFCHKRDGWFRANYIRIGESVDQPIRSVIYAIRNIDEEKKNVEKWIRKSNTDELTGFYNRHAYEEEIALLKEDKAKRNFVYVSVDVNGLKVVNDTLGHEAGDELIVGACDCMRQCFGSYGKLYRIGGDEFVALIFADEKQLAQIKEDLGEVIENWTGKFNRHLTLSCGYVTQKEAENMSIHRMAVLADKRMYEEKRKYYQKRGIDRRGQRDAHVALCALYTKILKINVTEDTYQIVNMNDEERTKEKGFSDKISEWLYDFGTSGQVHPEDLDDYLAKTNLEYMRNYFKRNSKALWMTYRRKYNDEYRQTVMEIIPANDYSEDSQSLFLYVKNIER